MRLFWSHDRVEAWKAAIFSSPLATETVSNRICLSPHVHRYHGAARFALQPADRTEDGKRLKVRFFWLVKHENTSVDFLSMPTFPTKLDHGLNNIKLWNVETEQKLCSGDEIWLETNDPEELPLPDWRILDMQWILQQLASLSGGAEPKDDSDDEDGGFPTVEAEAYESEDENLWDDRIFSPRFSVDSSPSSPPHIFSKFLRADNADTEANPQESPSHLSPKLLPIDGSGVKRGEHASGIETNMQESLLKKRRVSCE
jgi:hypothetical protein